MLPQRRRGEESKGRFSFRGKPLDSGDLERIRRILRQAKGRNLREIAEEICGAFGWYRPNGVLREASARALLRRLEKRGLVRLPSDPTKRPGSRHGPTEENVEKGRRGPGEWPDFTDPNRGEQGRDLVVRPILTKEHSAWREYMECYHYLGCGRIVGESICYGAFSRGRVVGLLAWAASALKCGVRDRYVGWDEATKVAKLGFVTNNVRFLILPWAQQKNLASQILAMNVRRLSADWEKAYRHPVYLAETFVDAARFQGTCYRASNWMLLGETRGWRRCGEGYQHHGERKLVFVYPLARDALNLLKAPEPKKTEGRRFSMIAVEKLPLRGKGGLVEEIEKLIDFRKPRGVRFSLVAILSLAACATMSGAKSFAAMAQWAAELPRELLLRLGCRRKKPPSVKTFRRILNKIGPEEFEDRVGQWFAGHAALGGEGVSVDGKTACGSADDQSPAAHLLSAFTHQEGVVVAEKRVSDKTNEIPCIQPLLEKLDVKGAVITADAMHTQKETARYIVEEKKADYLFTVKDNQPSLRDDIALLHLEAFPPSGDHGQQGPRSDRNASDLGE
jgi:hypothetical protein